MGKAKFKVWQAVQNRIVHLLLLRPAPAAPPGISWGSDPPVLVNFSAVSALPIATISSSWFKIPTPHFIFVTGTGADCQRFFFFCKVVVFHYLLAVLSVVPRDKCCSTLAGKRGCSDHFWSDKMGRRVLSLSTVESTVGKQSISLQQGMEQTGFCRQEYCLTLAPTRRQCYLFSILPNIQFVAVSCMPPNCCLDTSYVFPRVCTISIFIT